MSSSHDMLLCNWLRSCCVAGLVLHCLAGTSCDEPSREPAQGGKEVSRIEQQASELYEKLARFHDARGEIEDAERCGRMLSELRGARAMLGESGGKVNPLRALPCEERRKLLEKLIKIHDYCLYEILDPWLSFAVAYLALDVDPNDLESRMCWERHFQKSFPDPATRSRWASEFFATAVYLEPYDPFIAGIFLMESVSKCPYKDDAKASKKLDVIRRRGYYNMPGDKAAEIYENLSRLHELRGEREAAKQSWQMARRLRDAEGDPKDVEKRHTAPRALPFQDRRNLVDKIIKYHDDYLEEHRGWLTYALIYLAHETDPDNEKVKERWDFWLSERDDGDAYAVLFRTALELEPYDPFVSGMMFLACLIRKPLYKPAQDRLAAIRARFSSVSSR